MGFFLVVLSAVTSPEDELSFIAMQEIYNFSMSETCRVNVNLARQCAASKKGREPVTYSRVRSHRV